MDKNQLKISLESKNSSWDKTKLILKYLDSTYEINFILNLLYTIDFNIYEMGLIIKKIDKELKEFSEVEIGSFFIKFQLNKDNLYELLYYFKNIHNMIYLNKQKEIQKLAYYIELKIMDLPNDKKIKQIKKYEQIFMSEDIPYVIKAYTYFDIQYSSIKCLSYNLNKLDINDKKKIIFYDLLKCYICSNPNNIKKIELISSILDKEIINKLIMLNSKKIISSRKRKEKIEKSQKLKLEKGDFVKSLLWSTYCDHTKIIENILQNGNLSKEFLCLNSDSDYTPFDIDFYKINKENLDFDKIFDLESGPIWYILKNDDRFNYSYETRIYDPDKYEVYSNEENEKLDRNLFHYCIRTGISSFDIDCFVIDENQMSLEILSTLIVNNSFYIPVSNIHGDIIFTKDMYDDIKKSKKYILQ